MMIRYVDGDLLDADAEALVNTVNCVGVMGKGIALQFKQAFPDNFRQYAKACRRGDVRIGKMFIVPIVGGEQPKYIINFPTKIHWRDPSRIEFIEEGLEDLVACIREHGIQSVAIPPLGCGNGGLEWREVRTLIERRLSSLDDVEIYVYPPKQPLKPQEMKVSTKEPKLTLSRAALLELMDRYLLPGYSLSRLEVQKLAYFLQVAGQDLKLKFVAHKFGPYARELNYVLQDMEGHFIREFGDGSVRTEIIVLPEIRSRVREFLETDVETSSRVERAQSIIYGFETPYGLELLSTVHWVLVRHPEEKKDVTVAIERVHGWSERKRKLFSPSHIQIAVEHLQEVGAI